MSQVMNGMAGMPGQLPMPAPFPVENVFGFNPDSDQKKLVIFYLRPVHSAEKSRQLGYPYYENVEYVKMQDPGDNLTVIDRPAKEEDKARFPRHWAMFQQGRGGEHPGMDLALLFPDNPAIVARLKASSVHTVEQLSVITADAQRQIGMGALDWQQKAIKFLDNAKDTAVVTRMEAELSKRDEVIEALTVQVKSLTELLNKRFGGDAPQPVTTGRVLDDEEVI